MTPHRQLEGFLSKYAPGVRTVAKAALVKLRKRLPGAVELVYDNYNACVIAFAPSEKASQALISIALYPRWVTLFFAQGAKLKDPDQLLKGSGARFRHVVLESAADLDTPAVKALLARAVEIATVPIDSTLKNRIAIRAVVAKQRPRRPTAS